MTSARSGLFYAIAAYGLWGVIPLYFKLVASAKPDEVVAHRVVWSVGFCLAIMWAFGRIGDLRRALSSKMIVRNLAMSAALIAGNWFLFIRCVTTGDAVQASLGYFILPLVNALLGIFVLRERPNSLQLLALTVASVGVGYLALTAGEPPYVAIILAVSFAFYGLIRKRTPVDGLLGLTIETLFLTPLAFAYLIWLNSQGELLFTQTDNAMRFYLAMSGVITMVPLICFAQAVRRLSLLTIGFIQYLSPTLQLVMAIGFGGELFGLDRQIGFGFIWAGIVLFLADSVRERRARVARVSLQEPKALATDGRSPPVAHASGS